MDKILSELPLFVFGTLRRGEPNHHFLNGRYERCLKGLLLGFIRQKPLMIARRSGSSVRGEVFFLRPGVYRETLRDCDRLEGIPDGKDVGWEYRRIIVPVETILGTFDAWAYVHPGTQSLLERTPSSAGLVTDPVSFSDISARSP